MKIKKKDVISLFIDLLVMIKSSHIISFNYSITNEIREKPSNGIFYKAECTGERSITINLTLFKKCRAFSANVC